MDKGGRVALWTGNSASGDGWKACEGISNQFPIGLRVLVVDDDPTCLVILEKMLRNCLYEVTTCQQAVVALSMLREKKGGFDLVISDVYMPDMDGFKLLEHIGLEMDLPVIMMSADDGKHVVMKGVTHGACDYLIKPVRIEAIKNIWQHVVRKKRNEFKELDQSGSVEDSDRARKASADVDYASSANEGNWRCSKKRKDLKDEEEEEESHDDSSTLKKPRVVWTVELHQQFVAAVNQLGIEEAVPKKILELMNVPGLTRENVASHLQKYRSYLKRLSPQHPGSLNPSFGGSSEAGFGSVSSLDELDLQQSLAISQLPLQNITAFQAGVGRAMTNASMDISFSDQLNLFSSSMAIKSVSIMNRLGEQIRNEKANLLHALPITMDLKHLMNSHQPVLSFENVTLQASQGGSGFQMLPMSQRLSSSHEEIVHGHHSSSLTMKGTQQLQPLSISQTQSQMQADKSQQTHMRGQSLTENAGGSVSELPTPIGQQIISSDLAGRFARSGTIMKGRNTSFGGTCLKKPSFFSISQALPVDYALSHGIEPPGNGFAVASMGGLSSFQSKAMFQAVPALGNLEGLENGLNIKGSGGLISTYNNHNELNQMGKTEWQLQYSNIAYNVTEHMNSLPSDPDFNSSVLDHQSLINQHCGQHRSSHLSGKDIVSLRADNVHRNEEGITQHCNSCHIDSSSRIKAEGVRNFNCESMLPTENFSQIDLMNAVLEQQREGIGLGEAPDYSFDGYSSYRVSD